MGAVLLTSAIVAHAQFTYTTNNDGTLAITGYTGPGGDVVIPGSINGYPVSEIENLSRITNFTSIVISEGITTINMMSFLVDYSIISVAIPASVTNIGTGVFSGCNSLTTITVDTNNPAYISVDGALLDKNQTTLVQGPCTKGTYVIPNSVVNIPDYAFYLAYYLTNVTIPNGVTNIGINTFASANLTSVTIPNSVASIGAYAFTGCHKLSQVTIGNGTTNIGTSAFAGCPDLANVYFNGNAPNLNGYLNASQIFPFPPSPTFLYYLPGTTGWPQFLFGTSMVRVLWNPHALTGDGSFGVRNNQFGFNITGSSNLVVVVEACNNFASPAWAPVSSNTLNTFIGTNGTSYFSDPQWTNYPGRYYRLRSP